MYLCETIIDEKQEPIPLISIDEKVLDRITYCEDFYTFSLNLADKEMLVLHINNYKNNKLILQQNRCLSPKPRDPRKRGEKTNQRRTKPST